VGLGCCYCSCVAAFLNVFRGAFVAHACEILEEQRLVVYIFGGRPYSSVHESPYCLVASVSGRLFRLLNSVVRYSIKESSFDKKDVCVSSPECREGRIPIVRVLLRDALIQRLPRSRTRTGFSAISLTPRRYRPNPNL